MNLNNKKHDCCWDSRTNWIAWNIAVVNMLTMAITEVKILRVGTLSRYCRCRGKKVVHRVGRQLWTSYSLVQTSVREIWNFWGWSVWGLRVSVEGWKLNHCVPRRELPIDLFRRFCRRVYHSAVMHIITNRQTDDIMMPIADHRLKIVNSQPR